MKAELPDPGRRGRLSQALAGLGRYWQALARPCQGLPGAGVPATLPEAWQACQACQGLQPAWKAFAGSGRPWQALAACRACQGLPGPAGLPAPARTFPNDFSRPWKNDFGTELVGRGLLK